MGPRHPSCGDTTTNNSAAGLAALGRQHSSREGLQGADGGRRTIAEHLEEYKAYLCEFPDIAIVPPPAHAADVDLDTNTIEVRVRCTPKRSMAVLEDAKVATSITYHLIVFRNNPRVPKRAPPAPTKYCAIFTGEHPTVPNLFVSVTIPQLLEHPVNQRGRIRDAFYELLSYIGFASPAPTPSYLVLSEPKHSTAFRLPLCFGRHSSRGILDAQAAAQGDDLRFAELPSDSDEDQALDFAAIWAADERQKRRHARSGLRSQMSAASTAAMRVGATAAPSASRQPQTATSRSVAGTSDAGHHTRPRLSSTASAATRRTVAAAASAAPSHAGPAGSAGRLTGMKGRLPMRYAMLCADDCAVIAAIEPFVPGGAAALPAVSRQCVARHSNNLHIVPGLICDVVEDEHGNGAPPRHERERGPRGEVILRTRVRQFLVSRLGDGAWWPASLRSFLASIGVNSDNITARNNDPDDPPPAAATHGPGRNPTLRVTYSSAGTLDHVKVLRTTAHASDDASDAASEGRLSQLAAAIGEVDHAATLSRFQCASPKAARTEECRFAAYGFAIPMAGNASAAAFSSLTFLTSRAVSRKPFATLCKDAVDTMTLDNCRGQTATLHYVGRRHRIRLQLPRHWHVVEPAMADPALVLYRCELPPGPVNPPFLLPAGTSTQRGWSAADAASSPTDDVTLSASAAGANSGHVHAATPADEWDYAALPPAQASGSSPPAPAAALQESAQVCGADGMTLHQVRRHPLHPPSSDEAPDDDWWRHLLPVITLRMTAAPRKSELVRTHPPQEATLRYNAKDGAITPAYFDLWSRWVLDTAHQEARERNGGGLGTTDDDVSIRTEPLRCGGMRGVLLVVEQTVVVETVVGAPNTPLSGPAAGPLAGIPATTSQASTNPSSPTTSSRPSRPSLHQTEASFSTMSSAVFHSCVGSMVGPPQSPAAGPADAEDDAHKTPPPPAEPVYRLLHSSLAAPPAETYSACSPPPLLAIADHARHLDVALLAHVQAWRWAAATPTAGPESSSGPTASPAAAATTRSNATTSAPPTPIHRPHRVAPTGHGGTQRRVTREVRVIAALLPPLWHQEAYQSADPTSGGGASRVHADAGYADDAAGDSDANASVERATQIWQTQALPAELAGPARTALVSMLRSLELLAPC